MNNLQQKINSINSARAQYNPLRGITLQRVVGLLEAGERGQYRDLQWLYRMVEKRDAVLRALVRRRSAALVKLSWDIKQIPEESLPKGSTVKDAEAQALALRTLYDGIGNFKDAIKFLALAEFRGFSILEKTYNGSSSTDPSKIDSLDPIKQWFWVRDGLAGDWKFDPDLTGSFRTAEPVDPSSIVVREVSDPVNEIGLIAFLRKSMSQKDWDGFVEVFGIPDIFFTMPPGMSAEDQKEWLATAEDLAGAGRGAIPDGGDVKVVGGDVRGTNPFKDHLEYQDTMMVLAGTGGKLTMLSEATGIGGGATNAHEDAFNELAQAEALEISEILRNALDAALLADQFPDQPTLAYFELAAEDRDDTSALIKDVVELSKAGIEMDVDDISERTGYSLVRKAAAKLLSTAAAIDPEDPDGMKNRSIWKKIGGVFGNRKAEDPQVVLRRNCRKALVKASAEDLQPLVDRLTEILDETSDDDLASVLEDFQTEELPTLAADLLDASATADAMADILSANLINGYNEVAKEEIA